MTTYCPRCLKRDTPEVHTCTPHPVAEELERLRAKLQAAEETPIKCIWCNLRMATVNEAAAHVIECIKSPNHHLIELLRVTESRAEAAEAEVLGHAELIRGLEYSNDELKAEVARLRDALDEIVIIGRTMNRNTETDYGYIARKALEVKP